MGTRVGAEVSGHVARWIIEHTFSLCHAGLIAGPSQVATANDTREHIWG